MALRKLSVCAITLFALMGAMLTLSLSAQDNQLTAEELAQLRALLKKQEATAPSSTDRLSGLRFGGYGDIHANFQTEDSKDLFDFHRLVTTFHYDFNSAIRFYAEVELEHAFVSSDDEVGGEIVLEQAVLEADITDSARLKFGRMLVPIGLVNKHHEPTQFNGVERPDFAKYIVPSTWSIDGIGFETSAGDFSAEVIIGNGLDGSEFDSVDGIRGGRMKERPGLYDPAIVGRVDWNVFSGNAQSLRIGVSGMYSGLENANKGGSNTPAAKGHMQLLSADYDYRYGNFDFRGVVAHTAISEAENIAPDVASEIFGWYQEVAYHWLPESWAGGKFDLNDATVFVRYDYINTQYEMPHDVARDPAGIRNVWTVGVQCWLTENLVLKLDYQEPEDETGEDLHQRVNLGVGYRF